MVISEWTIATKFPVVPGEALTVDWKQIVRRCQQYSIAFIEQVNVFGSLGKNFEGNTGLSQRLDLSANERLTENRKVPDVVRNFWICPRS